MGVDQYECKLCERVRHRDNMPIVYTCALTDEEINDPEFDNDVMDDIALDYERVCIWCIKDNEIKKTKSGCYYYEASDKLKQNVTDMAFELKCAMRTMQRFKSDRCKECKKPMRYHSVGLCGVCGDSIHLV